MTEETEGGGAIRELPEGGLIGQVLAKKSNDDFDVEWIDVEGGGGAVAGVSSFNGRTGAVIPQAGDYTAADVGAVSSSLTINGKPLTGNITLNAADIGAVSSISGVAASASKLEKAIDLKTSLGVTTVPNKFDGSMISYNIPVAGTLPVGNGGTGKTSLASGEVLVGNGGSPIGTRPITNFGNYTGAFINSSQPASNLINANTLWHVLGRDTGVRTSASLNDIMVRGIYAGISDLTANSSSLVSGVIYLVYE